MIRTEAGYARALQRLEDDRAYLERLEATLGEADLTREERERALQPALAFHAQLREAVEAYERAPAAAMTVIEEIREGLRQLSADEASVELWLPRRTRRWTVTCRSRSSTPARARSC